MTDPLRALQERLRAVFRYQNRFMVMMWRLGLGRLVNIWPRGSGRMLVLGHTGRRSGLRRWTPLNYARVDGQLYCVSGFGDRLRHGRNLAISRISMSQLTVGVSPVPSIDHSPPRVDTDASVYSAVPGPARSAAAQRTAHRDKVAPGHVGKSLGVHGLGEHQERREPTSSPKGA